MKTVLFAWELGAGSGHVVKIRHLASHLAAQGFRVVAAVTSLAAVSVLDGVVDEIHRMPSWRRAGAGEAPSSATLNDILVGAGLADEAFLDDLVAAWQRLYHALDPALVISEAAPAAALTARGRIPLVMTGNGFALPPHQMQAFPPLHTFSAPVFREDDTLGAVNTVARRFGLRTLDRLPQLFAGDAHLLHTLPLLDPYADHRVAPDYGLPIDYVPCAANPGARQVLVYLSQGVKIRDDVLAALRPVADRVRIHAPMMSEDDRTDLVRGGAQIEPEQMDLSQALSAARLVVHLGGSGLASEAVLAGVPQYLLVMHVEQHLTGMALERAGAGRLFTAYDSAQTLPVDAFATTLRDEAVARRAAEVGAHHRRDFAKDAALRALDDACARLLT